MDMQVYFKLDDVIENHAVTLLRVQLDGSPTFIGTVSSDVSFNIEANGNLPGNACWADVVHNRAIVNWLIDQRVPFNAS